MKPIVVALAVLTLTVACGKKDDKKSAAAMSINGISADKSWCLAERYDSSMDIVTRVKFVSDSKIQMARLLVKNDGTESYKYSELFDYTRSEYTSYGTYALKEVSGYETINLKTFSNQSDLAKKITEKRAYLSKPAGEFLPDRAIVLKSSGFLTSDSEMELFPCESYSPAFNSNFEEKPMVSFQVFMGQLAVIASHGVLPVSMMLETPAKKITITPAELEGTQWCKWYEMNGGKNPLLDVISFRGNTYRANTYAGLLEIYDEYPHVLTDNAANGRIYDVESNNQGGIQGTNSKDQYKIPVNYTMVEDAKGVRVLAQISGETSTISYLRMYYNCNDQRPLNSYPSYKKYLPKILELEKSF